MMIGSELCVQKYLCWVNPLESFEVILSTHTRTMKILPMREDFLIFWKFYSWRHRCSLTQTFLLLLRFYVFHATRYNVSKRNSELIIRKMWKLCLHTNTTTSLRLSYWLAYTTTDYCAFSWLCLFLMLHAGDCQQQVNQLASKFQ